MLEEKKYNYWGNPHQHFHFLLAVSQMSSVGTQNGPTVHMDFHFTLWLILK